METEDTKYYIFKGLSTVSNYITMEDGWCIEIKICEL